jgi:flagellar biosynthesis protein FlhG
MLEQTVQSAPTVEEMIASEMRPPRVIAVASGKGGVGKTNIAVNLGIALIRLGHRVLVVDADMGMANVDLLLGLNPKYNVKHVMSGKKDLQEVVLTGPGGLRVLPAGSGGRRDGDPPPSAMRDLIRNLRLHGDMADLIFIDTGAEISDNAVEILSSADEVLLVSTPEPTSIMDAYGLIRTLAQGAESLHVKLLVNMAEDQYDAQHVMSTLSQITRQFFNVAIEDIGWMYQDLNVSRAVRRQQPFVLLYPNTRATRSIYQAAHRITDNPNPTALPADHGIRGVINRLVARYI